MNPRERRLPLIERAMPQGSLYTLYKKEETEMKKHSKALLLSMCAALLVIGSVFGTIAYLTDTEAVTNTFSVGRVGLKLDEADVNEMGQPLKDGKVVEVKDVVVKDLLTYARWQPTEGDENQKYHLLPGNTYIKDPTVTVDAGSEESYVRMMVTVTFASALTDEQLATGLDEIFLGYDANKWIRKDKTVSDDRKVITYEYRYHTTVDGKNDAGEDVAQPLEHLFTRIAVPGEYDNDDIAFLGGMSISVEAHAIQAAGFDTEDAAWIAFGEQHK